MSEEREPYKARTHDVTPAQLERLAILMEECGEIQQAIGKVLRHGWEGRYDNGVTNREQLEIEIGDVRVAIRMLVIRKA